MESVPPVPAQPDRGIDIATEELVDGSAVVRLSWDNQVEALAQAIETMADDPQRRAMLGRKMSAVAAQLIRSWDERVAQEFNLIGQHARIRL